MQQDKSHFFSRVKNRTMQGTFHSQPNLKKRGDQHVAGNDAGDRKWFADGKYDPGQVAIQAEVGGTDEILQRAGHQRCLD
jgi:hypothetical protein